MFKVFLFLVFTAASVGLFADNAPVSISSTNKWIIVDKSKTKSPYLNVKIIDDKGVFIVNNKIKKTTKFNLKYVPDGNYTIETEDNQKIFIQQITVDKGSIVSNNENIVFKPHFNESIGRMDMNLMAQGQEVKLTLRNSIGTDIMTEKISNEVGINRRFNLSKLEPGSYYLDVKVGSHLFSKLITI